MTQDADFDPALRLCQATRSSQVVTDDGWWASAMIIGKGPAQETVQDEQITLLRTRGRWRFWTGLYFRFPTEPVRRELNLPC